MDYRIDYLAHHPAYAEEVAQLKYDQWLHTSPDRPYVVWVEEIVESARIDAFPMTLIVLHDTTLLGFVTLVQIDEKIGIENGAWMITLYVKAAYRSRGIGARLARRCIHEVKQMSFEALYLWSESAKLTQYYERLGWRLISQDEDGDDIMVYEVKES